MEPAQLLGVILKPISGALVGLFIGVLLFVTQAWLVGSLIGAVILLLLILFGGLVDILAAAVLWFMLLLIELKTHLVQGWTLGLSIPQVFGGGVTGDIVEFIFRLAAIYCASLVVTILLLLRLKPEAGIPDKVNLGCAGIGGLLVGPALWWYATAESVGSAWIVLTWGISGALLGLVVSFIPGPPWD
ncbi:MAG: hypothetical protein ACOYYU_01190 [Chloroflexota bacterium]